MNAFRQFLLFTLFIVLLVIFIMLIIETRFTENYINSQEMTYETTHVDLSNNSTYKKQEPTIMPMELLSVRTNDGILESDPNGNTSYDIINDENANRFLTAQLPGTCATKTDLLDGNLFLLDSKSSWAFLNPQCTTEK